MAEPYQDGVAIEKSDLESVGLNSINSTFRMYEISIIVNNGAIPLIPFDKEYIGSDAQHGDIALFSENNVDVAESRSVDNLDLQAISLCVPGPAENDVTMVKGSFACSSSYQIIANKWLLGLIYSRSC
ncbi:hypothetical protein KSP40_PGU002802 [Platanthera guangdongensis]|uniref:Uncharacterized protein n=1 Tax=Platanthera guangdongensis TaxID=2320717 RepID=A0ABR2M9A3_9ASPA